MGGAGGSGMWAAPVLGQMEHPSDTQLMSNKGSMKSIHPLGCFIPVYCCYKSIMIKRFSFFDRKCTQKF